MNGDMKLLLLGLVVGAGLIGWGVCQWRDSSMDGSGWVVFGSRPTPEDERYAGTFRRIGAAWALGVGVLLMAVSGASFLGRLLSLD